MGMVADLDSLWDYEHPGPTEKKFRELLPAALDSLDISYLAELLTQIARAEAIQKKFSEAQRTLDRVEKALPKGKTHFLYSKATFHSRNNGIQTRP